MLRWAGFFAIATFAPSAEAGPWVRNDKQAYSRLAVSRSNIEALDAYRFDTYSEVGLNEDWTATLKYERLEFDEFQEFNEEGWRSTLRRGFKLSPNWVASLEAGVMQGAAIGGAAACEALGGEARAGIGQSLQFKGKKTTTPAFWFAEAAYRVHEDGCNRKRLEFGYGQKVIGDVWAVSQIWLDDGTHNSASNKYQFEYLWKADAFELSFGTQSEFGGEFQETSVFVAISRNF